MRNDLERYVIEVNGIAKAEYPIFVKALKASLQLRQELPKCRIKLRDARDETSHLTYIAVAKGLQVGRHLLRQLPIPRERRLQGRLQPSTLLI